MDTKDIEKAKRDQQKWERCYCTDCEIETLMHIGGPDDRRCLDCGGGRTVKIYDPTDRLDGEN